MDNNNIDIQQLSVEDRNKFILGHFVHIWRGRISDDTLYQHVLNIQYFIDWFLAMIGRCRYAGWKDTAN